MTSDLRGDVAVAWTDESGTSQSWTGSCGESVSPPPTICSGTPITVYPSITCSFSCEQHIPTAEWQVIKNSTGSAIESGGGLEAHFEPDETGLYTIEFYNVTCNGVDCEDCTLHMRVIVQELTPSINVEKMVSADGGATWEEEVEKLVCKNVKFKITVTNDGDVPLNNIVVTDALSGYLEYVQLSASPTPDSIAPYIIWNFPGPIQPGGTIEITFSAHVDGDGEHTNCVKVLAETDDGEDVSAQDCAVVIGVQG